MSKKVVLITGFTGMDGSNLTKYLLDNTDCEIYGMLRRTSNPNYKNVKRFLGNSRVKFCTGDLTDYFSVESLVDKIKPDYLINFGANSFVKVSWDMPVQVFETNVLGCLYCLEAIRNNKPDCRFYQASSSEMFGDVITCPQNIDHPLRPQSPYGASKCAAHHLVRVYKTSYNLYAVSGILYNHEGINRGEEFVTRKITLGIARIFKALKNGELFEAIELGNLDAKRDWSDSEDFVDGIWRMLNQDIFSNVWNGKPNNYILSSGEAHSVREFIELGFHEIGVNGHWENPSTSPKNETYVSDENRTILVRINPQFYRPAEVNILLGDSAPARKELGWSPKTNFKELVRKMVSSDLSLV